MYLVFYLFIYLFVYLFILFVALPRKCEKLPTNFKILGLQFTFWANYPDHNKVVLCFLVCWKVSSGNSIGNSEDAIPQTEIGTSRHDCFCLFFFREVAWQIRQVALKYHTFHAGVPFVPGNAQDCSMFDLFVCLPERCEGFPRKFQQFKRHPNLINFVGDLTRSHWLFLFGNRSGGV